MGASVVRSDLPGAIVDPAGLYIAYDVAYQMERVTVKAQLSYGARDGSAHAGGGIGTSVAFWRGTIIASEIMARVERREVRACARAGCTRVRSASGTVRRRGPRVTREHPRDA